MKSRYVLAISGVFLAGGSLAVACGSVDAYGYHAEQYQSSGCIANGFLLAVMAGSQGAVGGCDPVCFVYPDDAGINGLATYVSNQCPPYPISVDAGPGLCRQALLALEAGFYCVGDGSTPPWDAAFIFEVDAAQGDATAAD